MDKFTPAVSIRAKDLLANSRAFGSLLDLIVKQDIKTVLDVRYGLGGWFEEIRIRWKTAKITGYELDEQTFKESKKDSRVKLKLGSFMEEKTSNLKVDLCVADFNNLTKLKRRELDELLSRVATRYLIFTDVACSKFHLNYRSYGLDVPEFSDYWNSFKVKGYRLLDWKREHWAASTALYKSTKKAT